MGCDLRTAVLIKVVDELWTELKHRATVDQPERVAEQQRKLYRDRILELGGSEGERVLKDFEALAGISKRCEQLSIF